MENDLRAAGAPAASPWLSLLVPTYEYPEGVSRILDLLALANPVGVECVISDDSKSDRVAQAVTTHPWHAAGGVRYRRNPSSTGAISNWNSLLADARGEFVLLMHHDECPELPSFFDQLRATVMVEPRPSHVVLNCLLPTRLGRLRSHVPRWLRRLLFDLWPSHVLRHNSVGPPSAWVARRDAALPYRTDLTWLVDVEWYFRVLRAGGGGARPLMPKLSVISLPQPGTSITAGLAGRISSLVNSEARLIEADVGRLAVLRLLRPVTPMEHVASKLEAAAWNGLRAVLRLAAEATGRPLPRWLKERA